MPGHRPSSLEPDRALPAQGRLPATWGPSCSWLSDLTVPVDDREGAGAQVRSRAISLVMAFYPRAGRGGGRLWVFHRGHGLWGSDQNPIGGGV